MSTDVRVAIVGAGFSGVGMAIRLRELGERDFVVLERGDDLGGTWRDNRYPGCACDVPSHLYSYSFAPNPDWSSTFSGQAEIWAYLRACAQRGGVLEHVRLGHEVGEAAWDEASGRWQIDTSRGRFTAQVLVSAMGALSEPARPAIPGLEAFAGPVFHSAAWDHDHDLTGERVAVIGTGASAIQFVPQIQPRVGRMHVFQRSAPWILPRPDRPLHGLERRLYRRLPAAQRLMREGLYYAYEAKILPFVHRRLSPLPTRMARRHLHKQVADPALRARLTPDYTIGCKRILISDDYYPALTRPNVELVTAPIAAIDDGAVVTADGTRRAVDTIILGTGFHVTDVAAAHRLRGREGRLLSDVWQGSPQAYLGTAIAGFPNLFMLVGPNTGLGHTSMLVMIEAQIAYVAECLAAMDDRGARALEVRPEVQAAYNADVQQRMENTVWTSGCASWYLDDRGRNTTLWPGSTVGFRRALRRFEPADYAMEATG